MPNPRTLSALGATLFALLVAPAARGQIIQIKTLPLAQGDQFGFFLSVNHPVGGGLDRGAGLPPRSIREPREGVARESAPSLRGADLLQHLAQLGGWADPPGRRA